MIIDGRTLAQEIYSDLKETISVMTQAPHLTIFTYAPNFETQKYLALKRRKAAEVGILVNVIEFTGDVTTEDIVASVKSVTDKTDGIVVQLPLPTQIDTNEVLSAIPLALDVDVVAYTTESKLLPPVVAAISYIAKREGIIFKDKKVVIVGAGKLVGKPASLWAKSLGAEVVVLTKTDSYDKLTRELADTDIIISGAGQADLIKTAMVKEGAVIFDAGTSEEGGELRGDVEPACADKAALFTPVPGGIGPLTVALLLNNLVKLKDA